jgi:hypothetical protein
MLTALIRPLSVVLFLSSISLAIPPADPSDPLDKSCYERYRQILRTKVKKIPATSRELYLAWAVFTLPAAIALSVNETFNNSKGAVKIFPAVGVIVAPILTAPFAIAAGLTLVTLASPITLTVDGVRYAYKKKPQIRKNQYLISLMSDLDTYVKSKEVEPSLKEFLQFEEIKENYDTAESALYDLSQAYEARYFCPQGDGHIKLMSLSQILRKMELGQVRNFVHQ